MKTKTAYKALALLIISVAVLAAALMLPNDAEAIGNDLPTLMNVEIVGDYLYWDAVDGATAYSVGVKNAGGYTDALKDENGNILKRQYFNLKQFCEDLSIPSGTFDVQLDAVSDYLWRGGEYLTKQWHGKYTNVASKPQLDTPTNVQLNDFVLSWDPVPNAENYHVVFIRRYEDVLVNLHLISQEDKRFVFDITETSIDLRECFLPDMTNYALYLTATADGFFTSEQFAESYVKGSWWLKENLPDRYIKNFDLAESGTLSWDPFPDAKAYSISVGDHSTIATVGNGIAKDPTTGRLSCDLNYYCAAFGCTPSELDIALSAYSDQVGNGGYRISGISYHVYKYAGVKLLEGDITYGGDARYGFTIGAYVSGSASGIPLNYEWQVHDNGVWTKIEGAPNSNQFRISSADLIGKYIRVSITAQSGAYQGTLNSATRLVGKALPYAPVPTPELSYTLARSNNMQVARIKINNYQSKFEYIISLTPLTGEWPTNAKPLAGNTIDVPLTETSNLLYIYARYAETDTMEGGTRFVGSSIIVPAKSSGGGPARDMIYPEYDTRTPTIYMRVGDVITIKYQLDPTGAISNLPRWNSSYDGMVTVINDAKNKTLTIKATSLGTAFVRAYKENENTPWYYGTDHSYDGRTIKVVIYDPNNLSSVPKVTTHLPDVELYIGDTYTVDLAELSKLPFVPNDVNKNRFYYSAYVLTKDNMVGMPFVGETSKDGSVTIKNAMITAKKAGQATVYVFALSDNSVPTNAQGYFAYFNVKVSEKPKATIEKITLNNTSLTLRVGDSINLTALKEPVDATDAITWSSSNPSSVRVDGNGKITAVGKGTATITAKCGATTASCTIDVLPAFCSEHKNVVYSYHDADTHMWTCTDCGACGTESHSGRVWSSDGTYHYKTCDTYGCGAIIASTKAAHSATGANAANCQHKAVCDICKKSFGTLGAHSPSSALRSDKTGHWNTCKNNGCTAKLNFAAHTPDHAGHATEEYAIKCKSCGYVIESQLGHVHEFDKEVATEAYIATDATCTKKATYFISCECGEKGTETFESGELAPHICGTEWHANESEHWHICATEGCGTVINSSKGTHEFVWVIDKAATETEVGSRHEKCNVCGFEKPAVEIPPTGADHSDTANEAPQGTTGGNTGKLIILIAAICVIFVGALGITIIIRKKKH